MIPILRMLFICAFLPLNPLIHGETVTVPVEIHGGGTVVIEPENPDEITREIHLRDGERGEALFPCTDEGTRQYLLYESGTDSEKYEKDSTVYVLKIMSAKEGTVLQTVLYAEGSDKKSAEAVWQNRLRPDSPDTGDRGIAEIYAMSSVLSLLFAAVLFHVSKGDDDEA